MNGPDGTLVAVRIGLVAAGLAVWRFTQYLLSRRASQPFAQEGTIRDGVHDLTAPLHGWLLAHPRAADGLLIVSSAVIDLFGIAILLASIFGPTIQPYLGLILLFGLRQVCQWFCALPIPPGMIWRDPGVPTLLVTYKTSNDLFFSGHTALAVYGAACLSTAFGAWGIVAGASIALFLSLAVLVLRAHYTMDVFAGAVAALYVHEIAVRISPVVDSWVAGLLPGP